MSLREALNSDDINVHLDAVKVRSSLIADIGLCIVRFVPKADVIITRLR